MTIVTELGVDCNIFQSFIVTLFYNNRKMFCKLDIRHK